MREFTFETKKELLRAFQRNGYKIISFADFINFEKPDKFLILRHDVDRFPLHSLRMAKIEASLGIRATYYFRTRRSTFKPAIIKEIEGLGHEIGYHYENLADYRGNYGRAIEDFSNNLRSLRRHASISTICRHGSPLSNFDNKDLWSKYDYSDYDIIADTAFDVDYDCIFYVTDNGWGWNNTAASVRDKVESEFNIPIESTRHLIKLLDDGTFPAKVMLNAHADTFNDLGVRWYWNKSLIQLKNIVKRILVKRRV